MVVLNVATQGEAVTTVYDRVAEPLQVSRPRAGASSAPVQPCWSAFARTSASSYRRTPLTGSSCWRVCSEVRAHVFRSAGQVALTVRLAVAWGVQVLMPHGMLQMMSHSFAPHENDWATGCIT